jgi:hypothetical protein
MDATQWSVLCGIVSVLAIILWIDWLNKQPQYAKKEQGKKRDWYECPKCFGKEYYWGVRNIVTGKNALGWTRTEDKQVRCCKLDDQELIKKSEWILP